MLRTEPIASRILYEDNHFVVVNKLCSEIVQGDKSGDEPLLEGVRSFIKKRDKKPGNVFLGAPHRLDRPTSGIVIFAKTDKGLSRMSELFKEKRIRKIYWAVLDALPPEQDGELRHYLVRDRKKNKSFASDNPKGGGKGKNSQGSGKAQLSRLSYRVLSASDNYYLVEVDLLTGRHHQIRAQFAALGCHVKGDIKYGARRTNKDGGIHLHARRVEFMHPIKNEQVIITADPPSDPLWDHFKKLV